MTTEKPLRRRVGRVSARGAAVLLAILTWAAAVPAIPAALAASTVPYGPVHGRLTARNHSPVANRPFWLWLTVTDRHGRGLNGRVYINYLYYGSKVGTNTGRMYLRRGHWKGSLTFPRRSVGIPLTVQVIARTNLGSITMTWGVKVKK